MGDTNEYLDKAVRTSCRPRCLTTPELLDVLRRNHLAMNRDDSPYWQAEQTIRALLATLDMVAALAGRCGHRDDVCIDEIKRLIEEANRLNCPEKPDSSSAKGGK